MFIARERSGCLATARKRAAAMHGARDGCYQLLLIAVIRRHAAIDVAVDFRCYSLRLTIRCLACRRYVTSFTPRQRRVEMGAPRFLLRELPLLSAYADAELRAFIYACRRVSLRCFRRRLRHYAVITPRHVPRMLIDVITPCAPLSAMPP